ncbi:hypothetical protein [Nitrospira sp. Kam-Ns4a]
MFRYPTDMGEPTVEEAREALALAREVYEAILARLPDLPAAPGAAQAGEVRP